VLYHISSELFFEKCGFNLKQINYDEIAANLSTAEDDWGQWKAPF
jgi:hypothetical protein